MRVTLIHNPDAGSGSPTRADLTSWLAEAGYDVWYRSTATEHLPEPLAEPADLVILAGGDGTVSDLLPQIAGRGVPVAILPLGTANNTALSLGITGTPREIIGRLRDGAPRVLDIASARGPWGTQRFVESGGVGLFAHVLLDAAEEKEDGTAQEGGLDAGNRRGDRMRRVLSRACTVPRRVVADGVDLSGEYLFVGAFNIACIGPRLALAPDADPGDGRLDLLLVPEQDRAALAAYLERVSNGDPGARHGIPTRTCEEVILAWDLTAGHLDDSLWPPPKLATGSGVDRGEVVLTVEAAVQVLGASVS